MNLLIRPSRDKDVPTLAAIYATSVATDTASWEFARRRSDVLAKAFPYFTAELDGSVVGYSHASSYRVRDAHHACIEYCPQIDYNQKIV